MKNRSSLQTTNISSLTITMKAGKQTVVDISKSQWNSQKGSNYVAWIFFHYNYFFHCVCVDQVCNYSYLLIFAHTKWLEIGGGKNTFIEQSNKILISVLYLLKMAKFFRQFVFFVLTRVVCEIKTSFFPLLAFVACWFYDFILHFLVTSGTFHEPYKIVDYRQGLPQPISCNVTSQEAMVRYKKDILYIIGYIFYVGNKSCLTFDRLNHCQNISLF